MISLGRRATPKLWPKRTMDVRSWQISDMNGMWFCTNCQYLSGHICGRPAIRPGEAEDPRYWPPKAQSKTIAKRQLQNGNANIWQDNQKFALPLPSPPTHSNYSFPPSNGQVSKVSKATVNKHQTSARFAILACSSPSLILSTIINLGNRLQPSLYQFNGLSGLQICTTRWLPYWNMLRKSKIARTSVITLCT